MTRRRIIAAVAVALAVSVPAVLIAAGGEGDGRQKIAVVFESASSLIPENDVLVAGVPVGVVETIELTEDLNARVVFNIDERFTPFHQDASCELGTKLLLGEKSVNCDPGDPSTPLLAKGEDDLQTVPLEQTSAPVDLDLVLAGARLPYRQRLQIVLNEFGALGAARGDDINEVIRRANPALRDARKVFEILNEQRSELKAALTDTDTILASIAKDPDALGGFVREARNVTRRTAAHADDIDQIVGELPSLLAEARPGLDQLDRLTMAATPVARGLKESAPDLTDLAEELQPFADKAKPALRTLDEVAVTGRQAVDDSVESIDALKPAAEGLDETLHETFPLTNNLTKRGGPEGTMSFIFNVMSSVTRFDRWSHILPVRGATTPCTIYNTGPTLKECENRYDTDGEGGIAGGGEARKPAGPSGFANQVLTEAGRAAGAEQKAKEDGEDDAAGNDRGPRLPEALDKPVRETTDKVREGVDKVKDTTGKLLDFLLGP